MSRLLAGLTRSILFLYEVHLSSIGPSGVFAGKFAPIFMSVLLICVFVQKSAFYIIIEHLDLML